MREHGLENFDFPGENRRLQTLNRLSVHIVRFGAVLACVAVIATLSRASDPASDLTKTGKNVSPLFQGPIIFEPNQGQADRAVKFTSRGPGYVLHLTEHGSVLATRVPAAREHISRFFQMRFLNTLPDMRLVGTGSLASRSSYYTGSDKSRWLTGISNFSAVQFQDAYPGIHVICHGIHGTLAYDFKVQPSARPELIAFEIAGNETLRVLSDGRLAIGVSDRPLSLSRPTAYQDIGGSRRTVLVRYIVHERVVAFEVGHYDRSKLLVICPLLDYSGILRNAAGNSDATG
jgi:hypothetical protein